MMTPPHSKKTVHLYQCLLNYMEQHGWAPTLAELCKISGQKQSLVKLNLDILRDHNIIKLGKQTRQIALIPKDKWDKSKTF